MSQCCSKGMGGVSVKQFPTHHWNTNQIEFEMDELEKDVCQTEFKIGEFERDVRPIEFEMDEFEMHGKSANRTCVKLNVKWTSLKSFWCTRD